jgi:hypothetical protein
LCPAGCGLLQIPTGAVQPDAKATSWLCRYLVLEGVLDGLQQLVRQLLGIQLEASRVPPEEGWGPHLLKLTATHVDLGPLGTLYLDLASRCAGTGSTAGTLVLALVPALAQGVDAIHCTLQYVKHFAVLSQLCYQHLHAHSALPPAASAAWRRA